MRHIFRSETEPAQVVWILHAGSPVMRIPLRAGWTPIDSEKVKYLRVFPQRSKACIYRYDVDDLALHPLATATW
jgi:hypothetical protein